MQKNIGQGTLFVVSASSGAGKTSLVTALVERNPSLKRVVTYTTKQPRPQEVSGRDYCFVTQQEFRQKIKEGFFLEWSADYGAYYGTPRSILYHLQAGQSYIVIVDVKGAHALRDCVEGAVLIWIGCDLENLRARLIKRGQDDDATIACRLEIARKEHLLAHSQLFDCMLINEDFNEALNALESLIKLYLR